jgi:hypothetical protein
MHDERDVHVTGKVMAMALAKDSTEALLSVGV